MATRTTRSQTRAIGANPLPSPQYNPLSVFGSNQRGPELVDQFWSFSTRRTTPSASQLRPLPDSPTPGVHNIALPDNESSSANSCLFGGPAIHFDYGQDDLDFPRGDPPDLPSNNDLFPNNDSDKEQEVEQVPTDMLAQLASAIQSLARSSRRPTSDSTPHTKVREPNQFDGTNPRKLQVFLVQLELNFQDRAKAFHSDCAKVTFVQSYLKGMALEWFEPDLLLLDDLALRPLWINNFKEFVLELQTNFGPHDPVRDVEHDLDHLSMKDGQRITKYVMEFNRIASQIQGYGEGALRHHFYNGLPDRIKDEIFRVGKPSTLSDL
jgi:hypothetical protein